MCLSRAHLNRRVKNLTGDDTTAFIRERRLARARQLLIHTTDTVGSIEMSCGFNTPGYLTRTFRKVYGITPSEFRRMNGETEG